MLRGLIFTTKMMTPISSSEKVYIHIWILTIDIISHNCHIQQNFGLSIDKLDSKGACLWHMERTVFRYIKVMSDALDCT